MKINDSVSKTSSVTSGLVDAKSTKGAVSTPVASTPTQKVTLSSTSSQLQSLEATVAASDPFDVNKVEQIKSAISDGQFKIDSAKVADGLITSVRDMLSAQRA